MNITSLRPALWALALVAVASGCQTTSTAPPPPPAEPAPMAEVRLDFLPQAYLVPIRTGPVRYRMLFAPESHAIWVTDEVRELKRDSDEAQGINVSPQLQRTAEIADARFIVIECRLESAFADSSVAYDVVGLRNIEVYLETPSGERVYPVQRIMAPHADETNQGALIRFGRTTVLVFPKFDLVSGGVSPISGERSVKLVLDGFHSTFHFEWNNVSGGIVETSDISPAWSAQSAREAVRTGYTSIYSLLSPLQRIVD